MATIRIEHGEWKKMLEDHKEAPHGHGESVEFLTWHSDFIDRFKRLLASLPAGQRPDQASIAPWDEIPEELKTSEHWKKRKADFDANERRFHDDIASFGTLEELADAILPLHNAVHNAVAEVYKEPDMASRTHAPRSTYFWQLHGLIEAWYQEWLKAQTTV